MTTAARPTFDPAKGGSSLQDKQIGKLSHLVSARDQPAHLTLKERLPGQDTQDELKDRDLRAELEEREKIAQIEKSKNTNCKFVPSLEQATQVRLAIKAEQDREREAKKEALLSSESVIDENELSQRCPNIVNARKMAKLDEDEDFGSDLDLSESDFDDDDDDDEDDPEELMAELNRIKQERQAEEERREREQREKEECVRSNLDDDASSTFSVKRRWDDDVPFKNCAREEPDPKRKLYINDTLRQEFHKRFMDKYIR
uniref:Protein CWC15 n=1 Tax=Aceria tosichella TaxID=561515 RepID=A0A6G1S5I5_9ACAR